MAHTQTVTLVPQSYSLRSSKFKTKPITKLNFVHCTLSCKQTIFQGHSLSQGMKCSTPSLVQGHTIFQRYSLSQGHSALFQGYTLSQCTRAMSFQGFSRHTSFLIFCKQFAPLSQHRPFSCTFLFASREQKPHHPSVAFCQG